MNGNGVEGFCFFDGGFLEVNVEISVCYWVGDYCVCVVFFFVGSYEFFVGGVGEVLEIVLGGVLVL